MMNPEYRLALITNRLKMVIKQAGLLDYDFITLRVLITNHKGELLGLCKLSELEDSNQGVRDD